MHRGLPTLEELGPELRAVTRGRVALGCALPALCVAGYGIFAWQGWWVPAAACVAAFTFLSYTSVSHDLVHRNLRLSPSVNAVALSLIELLGLRSGTAYRVVHLQHHRAFPGADDVEAHGATASFGRALWVGFVGPVVCWRWAYARHAELRARLRLEAAAIGLLVVASLGALRWTPAPAIYVGLSFGAGLLLPVATTYVPHRNGSTDPLRQTRLFRGWLWDVLFNEHLFHLEHHLYPAVPHHHWPELARRLDPHFQRLGVVPVKPW